MAELVRHEPEAKTQARAPACCEPREGWPAPPGKLAWIQSPKTRPQGLPP